MQWNWIQNIALPTYSTGFSGILHCLKILIYCVTRNKVSHNLCMRPAKHINIIQGKILLLF